MSKYFKLLRCHHYIKNFLIFFPLIFSGNIFNIELLSLVIVGFINFSLVSSIIYIINDIRDIDQDRMHSTKRFRPIASGNVSIKEAYIINFLLVLSVIVLNILFGKITLISWLVLIMYFIFNVLYSFGLKKIPLVDIFILVFGFVLRVIYGSVITSIEISNWLYLTVSAFSFYFGLGKRRNEITREGIDSRGVLRKYNKEFLDKNMYLCLSLAIIFYSLWTVDNQFMSTLSNQYLVYTVPLIILISMKYSLIIETGGDGDPVEVVLHDKILLGMILFYSLILLLILY